MKLLLPPSPPPPPPPPPPCLQVSQSARHLHSLHSPLPRSSINLANAKNSRSPLVFARIELLPEDITHLLPTIKPNLHSERVAAFQYFICLAAKLAEAQRFSEFAALLQALVEAGTEVEQITRVIDMSRVHSGLNGTISKGYVDMAMEVLGTLHMSRFCAAQFLGLRGRELLSVELNKMIEQGRIDDCISLLQLLFDYGFQVKNFVQPGFFLQHCMKMQRVDAALRYACLLPKVCNHYNIMICEAGRQGDLQTVFRIFNLMKNAGILPDMFTYRGMIDACGQCGAPKKAKHIFKEILDSDATPNIFVYNSYMNVHARNLKHVLQTYEHMKKAGVAADLKTYNIILKSCCLAGRAGLAQTFYDGLRKRTRADGIMLDVVTYSTVINMFGGAKMWENALKVKADMLYAGVVPDIRTWTSLIGACANAGLVDKAFSIFEEMLAAGCSPNTYCYNMLLNACVEAGQSDRAFRLFEEWKITGRIFSSIDRNVSYDVTKKCEGVFRKIFETLNIHYPSALNILVKPDIVTYNILLKACGAVPEHAREVMKQMEAFGYKANEKSWSTLLDAHGSAGDLRGAIHIFEEMQDSGVKPDVITYTSLIKACVLVKEINKAFEIFDAMKKDGVRPNTVAYHTLLRAQCGCGELPAVQRAFALYKEMRDAGFPSHENLLKGLLQEWAEGVMQTTGDEKESQLNKKKFIHDGGHSNLNYKGLLFKKTAVHAADHNANQNLEINLHGLTKTEARIAVLAVLRILKEQYETIEKDLVIITGEGKHSQTAGFAVVREAVFEVLVDELKLPVVCVEDPSTPDPKMQGTLSEASTQSISAELSHLELDCVSKKDGRNKIVQQATPATKFIQLRRPANFNQLKVPKEALSSWLQKKIL